ncbi:hypothetical protein NXH64_08460 [Butyrivibrio fibrisolvens]|uniref:hypothetical protein n=1 Tax=Pseudobutyrivibrio ruminis TaxID=46206 RepID=UPI000487A999|nr:hypothetical protein [Pseudobutyrivibrio ruminis]MDC7279532.1 hypothetical protein [Butyrivibrio fibrisolvens]
MKKISVFLIILAIVLSDAMCAVVAYNYCDLLWGGKYAGYSAPASTAYIYAIPFIIGIIICLVLALLSHKKGHRA